MLVSYLMAQRKYAQVRAHAYAKVVKELQQSGRVQASVRITDLDRHALTAFRSQWAGQSHPTGVPVWDWPELVAPVRRRPTGLHLAIWSGEQLCGLAVGRASARTKSGVRNTLSVHRAASTPLPHPLRRLIIPIVIACAVEHGRALGASELRLMNPLPGALPLYVGLGFTVVARGSQRLYCVRRI